MADLYEQIERLDEENERLYKNLEAAQQALKDITGDARGLEAKAALVDAVTSLNGELIEALRYYSPSKADAATAKAEAVLSTPCGKPSS